MSPEQQTSGNGGRRAFVVTGSDKEPVRLAVHGSQAQNPAPHVPVLDSVKPVASDAAEKAKQPGEADS
jgi:hypothetical protein